MSLDGSVFRGRNLKVRDPFLHIALILMMRAQVVPKRTNVPGMTRGRGRGGPYRGGRGGGYRGGHGAPYPPRGGG
jgi:polyadenylate-binding protein 2